MANLLPHERGYKTVYKNSGFHAMDSEIKGTGFRILCQWDLDSGF